jgi:hypothetical protein
MIRSLRAAVFAVGAVTLSPGAPALAADRLIEGELVRVDLGRRILVLRPAKEPAHEVDVAVDAGTTITSSGRAVPLEGLKPLEKIAVSCEGNGSEPCRARRVVAGPARDAVGPAGPP